MMAQIGQAQANDLAVGSVLVSVYVRDVDKYMYTTMAGILTLLASITLLSHPPFFVLLSVSH
jgi:hypothetical protein